MRSPGEILAQIRTRYSSGWRDWLVSPPDRFSFPLAAPDATTTAREATKVSDWLRAWRTWASEHPTARLRSTTRRTLIGTQDIYTHVEVDDVDALAALSPETAAHWARAQQRYPQLVAPHLRLKPRLAEIVDLDDHDFGLLLRAAQWFAEHPQSGLTMRQVPIRGLHTKWLARHRRLVLALLDLDPSPSSPESDDELTPEDVDLLGLRPLPRQVDIILLDPDDRRSLAGLRHLRAPLGEIAALPLRPRHVLVVENKESALPVPDRPNAVVIHSLGNFLSALDALSWISSACVWYWGDLDRAGLTLLSRARTVHPEIKSVLMDRRTLERHHDLTVEDPTSRVDAPDPTLTAAELETLAQLADGDGYLRLEQERLPWEYVLPHLSRALDDGDDRNH
ncbi:Wadjet anti-phage system protein JetD domain-containing protein [Amycolatopsis sp. NPDC051758]|uniref:Wadjet anti-phage system protein JetD domain-containing protein n=1 Tax=Amycolatopsis sp. NPDC051758 TaxID=3363935 RepID=UPI00378C34D1